MFKINNKSNRGRCEIFPKLTINTANDVIGVALVSIVLTLNIFLVFLLLTLDKQMPAGKASYHLVKFVEGSHSGSKVIMILVCHLISLEHVIKGSYDFIGLSPSW